MAVGVVVAQAVAQPQHLAGAQGLGQRRLGGLLGPAGIAVGVQQALAGGQQRAQAVVLDRAALEDEAVAGQGRAGGGGDLGGDLVIALQLVLAAPAVEAEAGGAPSLRKIGPVSRSQMSPNRARTISTRRRRPAARGRRPRPRRRRPSGGRARSPGPARARARAATSSWAPSRFSRHSSAWLGKPSHMARCGDHSAGTRGVLMGRGKWP
jgi:hypothetical protein